MEKLARDFCSGGKPVGVFVVFDVVFESAAVATNSDEKCFEFQ